MSLDVAALRGEFPSLESGIAHFDGPGGTQTPAVVGAAIARTLTGPLSNRGTAIASERNADDAVAGFRGAVADLLGGEHETEMMLSRAVVPHFLPRREFDASFVFEALRSEPGPSQ